MGQKVEAWAWMAKMSIGEHWSRWIAEMCIDFPTIHVYGISIHNLTPCCPTFLFCYHIGYVYYYELYLVPKNHRTVTHKCFSIPATPTSSSSSIFASLHGQELLHEHKELWVYMQLRKRALICYCHCYCYCYYGIYFPCSIVAVILVVSTTVNHIWCQNISKL